MQISKAVQLTESRSFDIRVEAFNLFNHAQSYGPASVDGEINDPNFSSVVSAVAPRLLQLAVKFHRQPLGVCSGISCNSFAEFY
jgi:hypothetical protein